MVDFCFGGLRSRFHLAKFLMVYYILVLLNLGEVFTLHISPISVGGDHTNFLVRLEVIWVQDLGIAFVSFWRLLTSDILTITSRAKVA